MMEWCKDFGLAGFNWIGGGLGFDSGGHEGDWQLGYGMGDDLIEEMVKTERKSRNRDQANFRVQLDRFSALIPIDADGGSRCWVVGWRWKMEGVRLVKP